METKCGCAYCANRPEMKHGRVYDPPASNHMDIYFRLARVLNMHGTPGVPKPKKGGRG